MPSKYTPLESHLRDSGLAQMAMTFGEIERVIGAPLPPAALKHRAWWSNNPSNWVMTKAWLAAGYETEKVDMENRKLVFAGRRPRMRLIPMRAASRPRPRPNAVVPSQISSAQTEGHDNDSARYEPDGPDRRGLAR